MKKKFSLLLLIIFIFPLVAVLGCNDVSSYQAVVFSSWINSGFVSGSGTYDQGSTVTLNATALNGYHFICWLYQGSTIIQESDGYVIENTTNEKDEISKSSLTFTMDSAKQGKYVAVFSEDKIMYVKFDSFSLKNSNNKNATVSLTLWQNNDVSNFYDVSEIELNAENSTVQAESVKEVLQLSATETKPITANLLLQIDEISRNFNLHAGIDFAKNIDTVQLEGYSYSTTYENGTYTIAFDFTINEEAFTLSLIYKALN